LAHTPLRVAIVTNILTPYRVPLFNALAADQRVIVKVFLGASSEPDRHWAWPDDISFEWEIGSLVSLPRRDGRKPAYVAPGFVWSIARFRPDVVVAGGLALGFVGRLSATLARARFFVWLDATMLSDFTESPAWNRLLRRGLVRTADGGIASSTLAADYLRIMGIPPGRAHLSLLSVDVERLRHETEQAREEAPHDSERSEPVRLLYVGQLASYKGVDLLIRSFRELRRRQIECELICVGDGPLRPRLDRLARSHPAWGLQILGHLQPYELPRVWAHADVFCLFSRVEAFGAVIAEALAAGLPIVCSKHAGSSRDLIVEGENGYVVDPFQTLVCADLLEELVLDAAARARMGRRSLELAAICSSQAGAESFLEAVGVAPRFEERTDRDVRALNSVRGRNSADVLRPDSTPNGMG
jgi:glycosyltransferase involved in cell wall biosynthesis